MRVAVVGDLNQPHLQRWAEGLADAGEEVLAVGFTPPGGCVPSAVEIASLGDAALSRQRYGIAVPRLRRILGAWAPDVVHTHFVSSYGVLTALAGRHRPTVAFAWGTDILWLPRKPRLQQRAVRWALEHAAAVCVDAVDIRDAVAALAPGRPIELVLFGPESSWCEAARTPSQRVLSPRQLKDFYNVPLIASAFATISPSRPAWHLDVLTGGAPADRLRELARTAGAESRMTLWPRLPRHDVRSRFLSAEVVVSVPSSDATSVAVLEALAVGALPIVSDLPANRAVVEHEYNGLVVPPGDERALVTSLERAIDDEPLRDRAAAHNRSWVAAHATWERAVEQVQALSRRVAG